MAGMMNPMAGMMNQMHAFMSMMMGMMQQQPQMLQAYLPAQLSAPVVAAPVAMHPSNTVVPLQQQLQKPPPLTQREAVTPTGGLPRVPGTNAHSPSYHFRDPRLEELEDYSEFCHRMKQRDAPIDWRKDPAWLKD